MYVYFSHKNVLRKFLCFESSADGSLVFWLPRKSENSTKKGVRYTLHTTGTVHKRVGEKNSGRIFIDPLFDLKQLAPVAKVSIPSVEHLDIENIGAQNSFVSAVPDEFIRRMEFTISIGPKSSQSIENAIRLDFEIYSVFVQFEAAVADLPSDQQNYFFYGLYPTQHERAKVTHDWAKLLFWKKVYPDQPIIFRLGNGAYRILAEVPMRIKPKIALKFDRKDLRSEQISHKQYDELTHFVDFWICGKGGRIKNEDLRNHIIGWELDAEL